MRRTFTGLRTYPRRTNDALVPGGASYYTGFNMEQSGDIPRDDLAELPLFPLNDVVLFPGMKLPLHIFEERYKEMIGRCSQEDIPFGVLLIKEGQEVGDPAEPVAVGTTARIAEVQSLAEGRMNIVTQGERRFRVVEIIQQVPYLVGLVQYFEDQPGDIADVLVQQIRKEFVDFLTHQATLAGGWNRSVNVAEDPRQLFTDVMAGLAASLNLPRELRQKLLESSTTQQQLELLLPVLSRSVQLMQEQVEKNNPFKGARLN